MHHINHLLWKHWSKTSTKTIARTKQPQPQPTWRWKVDTYSTPVAKIHWSIHRLIFLLRSQSSQFSWHLSNYDFGPFCWEMLGVLRVLPLHLCWTHGKGSLCFPMCLCSVGRSWRHRLWWPHAVSHANQSESKREEWWFSAATPIIQTPSDIVAGHENKHHLKSFGSNPEAIPHVILADLGLLLILWIFSYPIHVSTSRLQTHYTFRSKRCDWHHWHTPRSEIGKN